MALVAPTIGEGTLAIPRRQVRRWKGPAPVPSATLAGLGGLAVLRLTDMTATLAMLAVALTVAGLAVAWFSRRRRAAADTSRASSALEAAGVLLLLGAAAGMLCT